MPQELTPRVIDTYDHDVFDRDSQKVRRITVVTYRLGDFGPFREEFEAGAFTEFELRDRMRRKADTLKPFT
jgi:hypothetical protein